MTVRFKVTSVMIHESGYREVTLNPVPSSSVPAHPTRPDSGVIKLGTTRKEFDHFEPRKEYEITFKQVK